MKVVLEFGIFDPELGEVSYSSDLEIPNFKLKQIPPIGTRMRFDRSIPDENGRYALDFGYDGGEPIFAILKNVDMASNAQTSSVSWYSLQFEVEQEERTKAEYKRIENYIRDMIKVRTYLSMLKKAKDIDISDAASGFDKELSSHLQLIGCRSLMDVATLSVHVFQGRPAMVESIETVLKQHGLMLFSGPFWGVSYSYRITDNAK